MEAWASVSGRTFLQHPTGHNAKQTEQACEAEADTSEVSPLNTAELGTKILTHEPWEAQTIASKYWVSFLLFTQNIFL